MDLYQNKRDKREQEVAITWFSMIYMLMYIPMVVPGTWLLNRYGLRAALLIGAGLNAVGACVKCVSMELSHPYGVETTAALSSFPILMLGQCICALAQVFTLGMPAQLAATWFGESEVALATAIGAAGILIADWLKRPLHTDHARSLRDRLHTALSSLF
ncbi:hypothetical protein ACTXT7_014270 [Hymenolepis weldensis]